MSSYTYFDAGVDPFVRDRLNEQLFHGGERSRLDRCIYDCLDRGHPSQSIVNPKAQILVDMSESAVDNSFKSRLRQVYGSV